MDNMCETLSLVQTISSSSSSTSCSPSPSSSYVPWSYGNPPRDVLPLVFQYTDCKTMIHSVYQVNRCWQALVDSPHSWSKLHFSGDYMDLVSTYNRIPRAVPPLLHASFEIASATQPFYSPTMRSKVSSKTHLAFVGVLARMSKLQRLDYYHKTAYTSSIWPLDHLRHCRDTLQEYVYRYTHDIGRGHLGSFDGYDRLVHVELYNLTYSSEVQLPASVRSLVLHGCRALSVPFRLFDLCHRKLTTLRVDSPQLVLERTSLFPYFPSLTSLHPESRYHDHLLTRVDATKIRSLMLFSTYDGNYVFPNLEELYFDHSGYTKAKDTTSLTPYSTLRRLHIQLTLRDIRSVDQLIKTFNLTTIDTLVLGKFNEPCHFLTLVKLNEKKSPTPGTLYYNKQNLQCVIYYTDIPNIRDGQVWRSLFTTLAASPTMTIRVDLYTHNWIIDSLCKLSL